MRAVQPGNALAILCFLLNPAAAAAQVGPPAGPVAEFELPRMPREGERLILTRLPGGDRLALRRGDAAARLPALPAGADLLGQARATAFGVEERCRGQAREGGIDLICRPGTSAAGLLLRFDSRYPRGAALAGAVSARGDPGFRVQFAHPGEDAADAREALTADALPIPVGRDDRPARLVILAPPAGGTLRIDRAMLAPLAPPTAPRGGGGAWAWEPALWQRSGPALLDAAAARGLDRLSVTLAVRGDRVEDGAALVAFVREARLQGIAVEAVEGDPDMVLEDGLASALVRARAIAAWQKAAPPDARLAGVQYDIEPYTLPAWGREPASWRGWARAVRALARAAGAPVHLILPFWVAEEEEGRAFLAEVESSASGITIMAYRTDAAAVAVIAEPLLAWAGAAGKPVRVALESGPVAEEAEESFAPAPRGRIAVRETPAGTARATLLNRDAALPGALMYAFTARTAAPPAQISFLGDERRMVETARELAGPLSAWSAFEGFAYHGLAWPGAPEDRR